MLQVVLHCTKAVKFVNQNASWQTNLGPNSTTMVPCKNAFQRLVETHVKLLQLNWAAIFQSYGVLSSFPETILMAYPYHISVVKFEPNKIRSDQIQPYSYCAWYMCRANEIEIN